MSSRFDPDQGMENVVFGAQLSETVLSAIDWPALDPARLEGWSERLTAAIGTLTRLRDTIDEARRGT